jgi:hypothetical protein
MAEDKRKFPTEVVSLPSKGHFYPEDSPLSSGEIEVKYMTAKEEDILTSQSLIRKGVVLDKLLEALVVSDVNLDDILIGDKNAVMVAARVLGYGKEYSFEYDCPSCGARNKDEVDLTVLEDKEVDFKKLEKGKNEFEFALPSSKRNVTYKILSQRDEKAIDSELKALKKFTKDSGVDPEITTRLKRAIVAVDGNRERKDINDFVDNEFFSMDSLAFRQHLADVTPDVDMIYNFECESCGNGEEATVPLTVEFFWPSARG